MRAHTGAGRVEAGRARTHRSSKEFNTPAPDHTAKHTKLYRSIPKRAAGPCTHHASDVKLWNLAMIPSNAGAIFDHDDQNRARRARAR